MVDGRKKQTPRVEQERARPTVFTLVERLISTMRRLQRDMSRTEGSLRLLQVGRQRARGVGGAVIQPLLSRRIGPQQEKDEEEERKRKKITTFPYPVWLGFHLTVCNATMDRWIGGRSNSRQAKWTTTSNTTNFSVVTLDE